MAKSVNRFVAAGFVAAAVVAPCSAEVDFAPGELRAKDLTELKNVRPCAGEPIVLVDEAGVAKLPVVMPAKPDSKTEYAAKLLARIVGEMTGTHPPVVKEGTAKPVKGPAIFVGDTAAAKAAGLAAPADHPEAFRVVTKDGSVYLLGPCGYAAYDWCERQLGARYYWPDRPNDNIKHRKEGTNEVYGLSTIATKGLKVRPVDYDDRPVFGYRIHWPYGGSSYTAFAKEGASHRGGVQVHCPFWGRDKDAQKHPGIYAMDAEGKRLPKDLLCYGNPETLEYFKWRLEEELAGRMKCGFYNPRNKVVTVSQADCSVYCECEHCKKLFRPECGSSGDASPAIWGYFTKRFAKWLKETHPDLKIAILPYHNTCDVPMDPDDPTKMLDLSPYGNVEAELCTMPGLAMLKNPSCKKYEEGLILAWEKCTGNRVMNWHYSCWPGQFTSAPFVYGETVQRHYKDMERHIVGTFINGEHDRVRFSLSVYVWMKCLWNPNVDVHAVYDEFARRMFGKAAKPMRELIALQEACWNRPWASNTCANRNIHEVSFPPADVAKMRALLDAADKLVEDGRNRARFEWYKLGFKKFLKESDDIANNAAFPELIVQKAVVPPVIDGKLDDACWKVAPPRTFVNARDLKDTKPPYRTEARVVWDAGRGVVFGFWCEEPATAAMHKGPVGNTWHNDVVEIFMDCSGEALGNWYQLIVDANGRWRKHVDGLRWEPKDIVAKTFIGDGFWTAEVLVPFDELKGFPDVKLPTTSANGVAWQGNLIRWRVGDLYLPKAERVPGSTNCWSRLNTRGNHYNKDTSAFSDWKFRETVAR